MAEKLACWNSCPFADTQGGRYCINPDRSLTLYCRIQIRDQVDPDSLHRVEVVNNRFNEMFGSKGLKVLGVSVDDKKYATIASGEITVRKPAPFKF